VNRQENILQTSTFRLNHTSAGAAIARLALLLGVALCITNLGMPQAISGVLVNALLLFAVEWAGIRTAMLVGMVTPLGAAISGVLPLPMIAMIPFIAFANAILVNVYMSILQRSRVAAVVLAAIVKFGVLFAITSVLATSPLSISMAGSTQPITLPAAFISMFQWPQLGTALGGGALMLSGRWIAQRIPIR
jgi:hypothetical protein